MCLTSWNSNCLSLTQRLFFLFIAYWLNLNFAIHKDKNKIMILGRMNEAHRDEIAKVIRHIARGWWHSNNNPGLSDIVAKLCFSLLMSIGEATYSEGIPWELQLFTLYQLCVEAWVYHFGMIGYACHSGCRIVKLCVL